MGVSTDALLVYGYVWSDECDVLNPEGEGDGDGPEWEEVVALKRGVINPWESYPVRDRARGYEENDRVGKEWCTEHQVELDVWRATKTAIRNEFGCMIDSHGSDQWSVPIVCIRESRVSASRGSPQPLAECQLQTGDDWDAKLDRFIDELSIDTTDAEGPGWYMASWWG